MRRYVLVFLLQLPAMPVLASAPLVLAGGQQARLDVVVSPSASQSLRAVANELADDLGRIAGAKFQVNDGDGRAGIVLGTLEQFPDPALADGLKIRAVYDGKEAYAIRTEPGRLRLIGATEQGASHAAFRLLGHLGCRWFFPAKAWEVIPSRAELSVSLDVTERPAFLSRRLWYGYGFASDRVRSDYEAWRRHNRQGASLGIVAWHAWQSIILDNPEAFTKHPEYLALVKGKRQGEQLCVSNLEVRRIAVRWALEQLKHYPNNDMVTMECSDGEGQCECGPCVALGTISDRVFGLANEAARAVAAAYPGKMVGLYAYNEHCEPPGFDLEPNVYVQLTAGFVQGKRTFDELLEAWPKRCRTMGFYEYLSIWSWDHDMLPGGRGADIAYLRKQVPRYVAAKGTSLDCESGNNWGVHGRGYYVANALMWDPAADVDAIVDDFHTQAFGPAASVMKRYYDRLDPGAKPTAGAPLFSAALHDLEEATRLAHGRADIQARLDHLKQYQHFVRLRWDATHEDDRARKQDATMAALRHAYRTRDTSMNHWRAMQDTWLNDAAKEFGHPEWKVDDLSPAKPWKVETTPTHAETEADFQSDRRRFDVSQSR